MQRILNFITNLFPVWVLICCAIALVEPNAFTWFNRPMIVWGLGIIMLGMGITLSLDDFKRVLTMPRSVATGLLAQFILMPCCAWIIAHTLNLPVPFKVGLILVACCPGGTASNVVTYLARANVALSVLMTMCSTAAAIFLTPMLTSWLAGQYVPVDGWQLFASMIKIVLLPLVLGVSLHHLFPKAVKFVLPVGPLVAVVVIALICASIIGGNAQAVRESGLQLLGAVVLLHAAAFASGYGFAKVFGYGPIVCRTVSIEVGMQNSGLATVLARSHFANPLTAIPCAISAVVHSVIGSILAGYWRMKPAKDQPVSEGI
ncbi:MAG TPA: bile acid:sodium symporter family protein [Oceanipulchritudo sp.]|nr:bile acid:sodium symporter family protein [Oceanipulchritudo sp.]